MVPSAYTALYGKLRKDKTIKNKTISIIYQKPSSGIQFDDCRNNINWRSVCGQNLHTGTMYYTDSYFGFEAAPNVLVSGES